MSILQHDIEIACDRKQCSYDTEYSQYVKHVDVVCVDLCNCWSQ